MLHFVINSSAIVISYVNIIDLECFHSYLCSCYALHGNTSILLPPITHLIVKFVDDRE